MQNISMNIIIFSKDRACQLDLLLNSMQKMFRESSEYVPSLLYTTSNVYYKKGYQQLKKKYKKVKFIKERNFKIDLIDNIDEDKEYTVFFVDDIAWKEPFSINCNELHLMKDDSDILCLSLRLDPNLTYCYAYNSEMKLPELDHNLCWNWAGVEGDFGYPMSLDGHIFRTKEILPLISNLQYTNPNSLEGKLSEVPLKNKKMICLEKSPIFNLPINKVQTHNSNRHGNISAKYLNDMFFLGYRIGLSPIIGFRNNACHQEVDVTLKRSFLNMMKNVFH
jgi:hypothetical protein